MPAAVQETNKVDHSEQMWKVLKAHILRERARKKQEREQEVEEERLRKEREAREQQDVMTLGETREQISQLESKLTQLKEEKHQFEQMIAIQALPSNMVHQQLYIQQTSRLAPIPQQQQQNTFKTSNKRPRSPSPQPQVPVSLYHGYGYKPPAVGTSAYQSSPQKDDGRRNELVRAVLWNKTPQYTNQPSAFYPVAPQELSIYYPLPREPARNVYESPRPQTFHLEQKLPEHYALRTPSSHGHVIHPGSLPINPQQAQPKGGSITAGYPVRSQTQYQQSAAPASLYTAQSRPLYQSSGAPMNYPTRE
ncbi:hypothetical protein NQ314_018379 [Rhamnusium bicolor]|uniref:G protein pathway suppressor 2 n=1 Tax=Rhamnusium bicolor TaxID=1586634 RepID=A0AAV8WRW3_9CUCU|nr:hypothetical protein NQ314_018379 [Rhamnusium bicolor]